MKVYVQLKDSELRATKIEAKQADAIIHGFFSVLGAAPVQLADEVEVPKKVIEVPVTTVAKPVPPKYSSPSVTVTVDKTKLASPAPLTPKTLPKIDDGRSLSVPIGELLQNELTLPANIRTLEDGTKIYQAHYDCDCGHSGRRYIVETNNYLKCHKCNEKLLVEAATLEDDENGIPKPDIDGNFFIARDLYDN